jgi:hypothetical protein
MNYYFRKKYYLMKNSLFLLLSLLLYGHCNGQYLVIKSTTETQGMPEILNKMGKSFSVIYTKKGMIKTETTVMKTLQTNLIEKDKITVTNPDLCGIFTKEELLTNGLNDDVEYKDVTVTKTEETENILGFNCKKAILNFKIVRSGEHEYESIVWYTTEIQQPDNSDLPQLTKPNDFTRAMSSLGGVVLHTQLLMKSTNVTTLTRVTEISTNKIDDSVFMVNEKLCKKPKNLQDYKKELKKREHRADSGFY